MKRPPADPMILECPRCGVDMEKKETPRAVLDCCPDCSGHYFDAGEMTRVLGRSADPQLWIKAARQKGPGLSQITCPRCAEAMALVHLAQDAIKVEVDVCAGCEGVFLDGGEVEAVMRIGAKRLARRSAKARAAREQAAQNAEAKEEPKDMAATWALFQMLSGDKGE